MAFGLGQNVGRAFVSLHANGDDVPDEVRHALDRMTPEFALAGEKHAEAYSKWFDRESTKNANRFFDHFRDQLHDSINESRGLETQTDRLNFAIGRLTNQITDNDDVSHHWLSRFHGGMVNINRELDLVATRTGRLFGRGSRNDLLNFIGITVEFMDRLVLLVPKAAEKLTGLFSGGGSGMNWAKMATDLAAGIVGISIALAALVSVAGAASALVNGITAALIGLVASATFAAGAVLGVAAALAGPLVAGIGVAILALANLDKETKRSFDGIQDSFKDLGKSAGEAIGPGIREAVEIAKPAIAGLEPVIDGVAASLGRVAVGWAKAVTSPDFIRFRNAMEKFLPGAIERLGQVAENVFAGIGGMIRAAIPITNEFLNWLVKVTDNFAQWANSREGQRELRQFFRAAADSAKAIGDFLYDAVVALADLVAVGKDSGDTLFQKMADSLARFSDYLTDPKNQAAIADFFNNGIVVAEQLGNAILDIADALGKLDTEESRAVLSWFFDAFSVILDVLEKVSAAMVWFHQNIVEVGGPIGVVIGLVMDAFGALGDLFHQIGDWAGDTVHDVVGWFKGLPGKIADAVESIPGKVDRLLDKIAYNAGLTVGRTVRWFAQLPGKILGALAALPSQVLGLFGRVADRAIHAAEDIISWFAKLPGRIDRAIGSLWGTVRDRFDKVVDGVEDIIDDVIDAFTGLGGKILSAIGSIDIGSLVTYPGGKVGNFIEGFVGGLSGHAAGGIVDRPTLGWTGEEGREAIVPLNRPLSMVDPSVRGLSAIAQGLAAPSGGGITVQEGAIVVYEAADGRATAREVLNDLIAFTY